MDAAADSDRRRSRRFESGGGSVGARRAPRSGRPHRRRGRPPTRGTLGNWGGRPSGQPIRRWSGRRRRSAPGPARSIPVPLRVPSQHVAGTVPWSDLRASGRGHDVSAVRVFLCVLFPPALRARVPLPLLPLHLPTARRTQRRLGPERAWASSARGHSARQPR